MKKNKGDRSVKIYDITLEVFGCVVFGNDPAPGKQTLCNMEEGDLYNLTAFSMCAHNGTHLDAPAHFLRDGQTVEKIPLDRTVGAAYLTEHNGPLTAGDAETVLAAAQAADPEAARRLLFRGSTVITLEAAKVFARAGVLLLGNESQTVGPEDTPMEVHQLLLGANVILLEGIRLKHVPEGAYFLNAAPLNLAGADGAPCRAILIGEV
jgi:arylformamidase